MSITIFTEKYISFFRRNLFSIVYIHPVSGKDIICLSLSMMLMISKYRSWFQRHLSEQSTVFSHLFLVNENFFSENTFSTACTFNSFYNSFLFCRHNCSLHFISLLAIIAPSSQFDNVFAQRRRSKTSFISLRLFTIFILQSGNILLR